ncbi:MAG: serine hydrolase domain-containing protein [Pseudomonadota bacterium]
MNSLRAVASGIFLLPMLAGAADGRAAIAAVENATRTFLAANPHTVGMSIGVYHDGKTYTFNYGHLKPGGKQRPTADTIYPLASITKTFTGTLLAQAQVEGKLRLDDDIRKYLDGDYPNLEFDGHPIRLFDLVDHRSGLPFVIPDLPETLPDFASEKPWAQRITEIYANYSRQDFLDDLHKVKIESEPGGTFKYSNSGAALAAYILERIYREPYESLVTKNIATPLGMHRTTITLTPRQAAHRTRGFHGDGQLMPDTPDVLLGAGGIKSSVNDMLRYIAWQIRESDPAVKLSHVPYVTAGNYAAGLNWQMLSAPGKRVIWQTGNIEGFHTYCIVEPELKLGLVALFNHEDQKTNDAHGVMVNEILKGIDAEAVLLP